MADHSPVTTTKNNKMNKNGSNQFSILSINSSDSEPKTSSSTVSTSDDETFEDTDSTLMANKSPTDELKSDNNDEWIKKSKNAKKGKGKGKRKYNASPNAKQSTIDPDSDSDQITKEQSSEETTTKKSKLIIEDNTEGNTSMNPTMQQHHTNPDHDKIVFLKGKFTNIGRFAYSHPVEINREIENTFGKMKSIKIKSDHLIITTSNPDQKMKLLHVPNVPKPMFLIG